MKKILIILIAAILSIIVISTGYSIVNNDNNTDINSTVEDKITLNNTLTNDSNDNISSDFNSEKNTQLKQLSRSNTVEVFENIPSDTVDVEEDINSNVLDIYDENISQSANDDSNHVEEPSQTVLSEDEIPFSIIPWEILNKCA